MGRARRLKGKMTQGDSPEWAPLENLVSEEIASEFMWMFEVVLSDGIHVQAYKHRETRGYLHLDDTGRAFVYEEPERYRQIPVLDLAPLVIPSFRYDL